MEWKFWHPGVVVKDLDKAIEYYSSVLGIGPFEKKDILTRNCQFRGKPCPLTIRLAQAKMGDVMLEIIQADPGDNPFWEFLKTHGEGLHHLAFFVEDIESEIVQLRKKGVEVLIRAETSTEKTFAYLESTPPSGTIIQLAQRMT